MGEIKAVDWQYVSNLGKRIEESASAHMPGASRHAADAQDEMMSAASGGGLLVVLAFFFASEYLEQSFKIKQEVAGELNNAAQNTSKNWKATSDATTVRGY